MDGEARYMVGGPPAGNNKKKHQGSLTNIIPFPEKVREAK